MNLMPSVVVNRMYAFGEAFATAKAWVLANLSTDSSTDGTMLDGLETDITTAGGEALEDRDFPWYERATLWADLPASSGYVQQVPGFDLTGQDGKVVTVADGDFTLATGGGGGGGVDTMDAFGSTPNADGATITGTHLELEPADATHPGGLSTGTQNIAGAKTFKNTVTVNDGTSAVVIGTAAGTSNAVWFDVVPGTSNWTIAGDSTSTYISCPAGGGSIFFYGAGTTLRAELKSNTFDFTGLGNGGSIKLKSPDGTTYTLSVANGGTLVIA